MLWAIYCIDKTDTALTLRTARRGFSGHFAKRLSFATLATQSHDT